MATYSFPALGFDPAPGDPAAIEAVARDCLRSAQELGADADQLKRLTGHIDWQGDAADTFATHPAQLQDDLTRASDAYGGAGSALMSYAAALRQAKLDARRLEDDAADARARADRHGAQFDRISHAIGDAPRTSAADQAVQQETARRLQASAQNDFDAAVARARQVQQSHDEAGRRAASRIWVLTNAPYHEPGVLSRIVGGAADWASAHTDALHAISDSLKTVSAIAGALSFIPVLTPILAPIAGITALGALAVDATMVATGHGAWRSLVVDATLTVLPVAGKVASRVMLVAKNEGLVRAQVTPELINLADARVGAFSRTTNSFGVLAMDGRRYTYGAFTPARSAGEIAGARPVATVDAATGQTVGWRYETYDSAGNVRSIRPQWGAIKGPHFIFDADGNLLGWR